MPRALLSLVTILALAAPALAGLDTSPQDGERPACPRCGRGEGQRRERPEARSAERAEERIRRRSGIRDGIRESLRERFEHRRAERRHELRERLERRRLELGRERLRARVRAIDGERRAPLERRLREAQPRSHPAR